MRLFTHRSKGERAILHLEQIWSRLSLKRMGVTPAIIWRRLDRLISGKNIRTNKQSDATEISICMRKVIQVEGEEASACNFQHSLLTSLRKRETEGMGTCRL